MNYQFFMQPTQTPQTEPIPGKDMIQGHSSGYAFKTNPLQMIRRCLISGTTTGTFYAGKFESTQEFVQTIQEAIQIDPRKVAEEIRYASDGRAMSNSAPLLALVLLSMGESKAAKDSFLEIFPHVVRTASHLYEWLAYTKGMRGFGRVIRRAGNRWLENKDVRTLAYQFLKYQQRYGYSSRDVLRLFHPKPKTTSHHTLYQYLTAGAWNFAGEEKAIPETLQQIHWFERVKADPSLSLAGVQQGRLTHEMVAPLGGMDHSVWQELFLQMPMGALLRNLGSLTQLGVLTKEHIANLTHIEATLLDKERLKKARIHPIDVLKALKIYSSGGRRGHSKKTWEPIPFIVDVLDQAVELSFEVQEPTNKRFLHAVDVSGSMNWKPVPTAALTCAEIATAMALTTAKAERFYDIRGFSTDFIDLQVSRQDSFKDALRKTVEYNFGATDAAVTWDWLLTTKTFVDVVVFWTDSESWAGSRHTFQAQREYRNKINPMVKAIYVTLTPNHLSLVDPNDPLSFDFGGFDPSMPRIVQMIANNDL
ncbi:TROVE domain-containing protein [Marininema halotolerans]|uniref:SS-A/Ro ribonucleoprotein n=1 Tax=Marininema halotolerans TaxID=1155944 RepID=A0A1I6RHL1_9BACL|nr:TROVE domain-containing protein [Marininema halotolerans]SFS64144.1 SS-A/Ro ribonucleoprotein [Marininema halotolerans]